MILPRHDYSKISPVSAIRSIPKSDIILHHIMREKVNGKGIRLGLEGWGGAGRMGGHGKQALVE